MQKDHMRERHPLRQAKELLSSSISVVSVGMDYQQYGPCKFFKGGDIKTSRPHNAGLPDEYSPER